MIYRGTQCFLPTSNYSLSSHRPPAIHYNCCLEYYPLVNSFNGQTRLLVNIHINFYCIEWFIGNRYVFIMAKSWACTACLIVGIKLSDFFKFLKSKLKSTRIIITRCNIETLKTNNYHAVLHKYSNICRMFGNNADICMN